MFQPRLTSPSLACARRAEPTRVAAVRLVVRRIRPAHIIGPPGRAAARATSEDPTRLGSGICRMGKKLYAISANTFLETIRQPIYGILMWVAAGLLMLNPSIASFSLERGGDTKMMVDIAMSTLLLYGLFASVFSATSVITREIESFTVLTVISKPVSRPVFFVGKFLGVALAMLIAYYFLALVFMMTLRHGVLEYSSDKVDQPVVVFGVAAIVLSVIAATFCNSVYGWHFSATLTAWVLPLGTAAVVTTLFFDKEWNPQSPLTYFGYKEAIAPHDVYFAVTLIFLAVMILTAFAVTLSTRFSQVVTLILCSGVFLLGLLSDYYFGSPEAQSTLLGQIGYRLFPNFQFHWLGDAITQQLQVRAAHVARVAAYSIAYTLAILSLGVALFQTREVG
jgi:ABC-2 type transport system permease protein